MMTDSINERMPNVLVVDDDADILMALDTILSDEGYHVEVTESGESVEYLAEHAENLPDLIILDIFLRGKDGRRIAHTLKNNEATKHIPIIMISAHFRFEDIIDHSDAEHFIAKPFAIESLLRLIRNHIEPGPHHS